MPFPNDLLMLKYIKKGIEKPKRCSQHYETNKKIAKLE